MVTQSSFPGELLRESQCSRLNYFRSITVPHLRLKEAYNALIRTIHEPAGETIIFVFGPTGVGKTTLRQRTEKMLVEEALPDLTLNPGRIAVAGVEAIPPERGNFSHQDYYIRALEALAEVLISYKVDYSLPDYRGHSGGQITISQSQNTAALRRALEKAFLHRQLMAFMVDEAQHLLAMAGGHTLLQQMNWIKSIANVTGTPHVLVGTYELLNCRTLSGQLGRRSMDIHLSRYHVNCTEDVSEFLRILQTFGCHMPLEEEPDLEEYCEYLLDYSIGCVGVLKNWLTKSLRIALEEGATTLKSKHLKQGEPSPSRRQQIREEALFGEKRLRDESTEADFEERDALSKQQQKAPKSQPKRGRVGKRNPKRDPVGLHQHES